MSVYWQGDEVTLYHGDCLEHPEWWTGADVLVTDPPYGIAYATNRGGEFTGRPIEGDLSESARDTALGHWGDRPAAVFASPKQLPPPGTPNRVPLIWDKGDSVGMGDLSWPWKPSYELVWVYGGGWVGPRGPAVLRHRVLSGVFTTRLHPTEKPVPLMHELISHAPPGVVADPFAGSGTTLEAARLLGRRAIGVEIDERYCEIAASRLAQGILI